MGIVTEAAQRAALAHVTECLKPFFWHHEEPWQFARQSTAVKAVTQTIGPVRHLIIERSADELCALAADCVTKIDAIVAGKFRLEISAPPDLATARDDLRAPAEAVKAGTPRAAKPAAV